MLRPRKRSLGSKLGSWSAIGGARWEKNRGLKEGFEALMGSGVLEEVMGREIRDEDDEWSRDGSSVSSGAEVGDVDEDNEMLDVGAEEEESEVDGWGMSEESSSSSDSE